MTRSAGPLVTFAGLALALVAGCYRSHLRAAHETGGPADAAVALDSGPRADTGILAPEPEYPDDVRPTLPSVPATPPTGSEPTLVPLDEPVRLNEDGDQGGEPSVVWNGDGWGVAWGAPWGSVFRVLDAEGRPIAGSAGRPVTSGGARGIDFAAGRYAVTTPNERATSRLDLYDRSAVLLFPPGSFAPAVATDVARIERSHEWLVAGTSGGEGGHAITVEAIDDTSARVAELPALATTSRDEVRIAGVKSRAVVVWTSNVAVRGVVVRTAPLELLSEPFVVLTQRHSPLEAEVQLDRVLVAGYTGTQVQVSSVDPWTATVEGPFVAGTTRITDRRAGIATAPEHGFYVVCFADGDGPWGGGGSGVDGVTLQVMGDDGARWGEPVHFVANLRNIGGVDCGWNGEDVVVIWWSAALDQNEVWSQRAHPTFL